MTLNTPGIPPGHPPPSAGDPQGHQALPPTPHHSPLADIFGAARQDDHSAQHATLSDMIELPLHKLTLRIVVTGRMS